MNIVRYTFMDAERLRYGRFPVLDTVLYRWARRIEETLFETARVEAYAGASVVEEMKFSTFYASLRHPRPIYFLAMEPLPGTGLFIVDSRFAGRCLQEPGAAGEGGRLSWRNQGRLQRVVQRMMADFDACWADIHPVRTRLRKVTTYPFRARLLQPYEPCLVAQIHLSGRNISSRLTWCWPHFLLEPVLPRLRERKVLPSLTMERRPGDRIDESTLLRRLRYGLQVRMGQVALGSSAQGLQVGHVVPLEGETGADAVVEVEGNPVWVGSVGQAGGHYAVKVDRAYSPPRISGHTARAAFRPLEWPTVSGE